MSRTQNQSLEEGLQMFKHTNAHACIIKIVIVQKQQDLSNKTSFRICFLNKNFMPRESFCFPDIDLYQAYH